MDHAIPDGITFRHAGLLLVDGWHFPASLGDHPRRCAGFMRKSILLAVLQVTLAH